MLTKSRLKNIFSEYGFAPLKRLGENYLVDANVKDRIIEEARVDKNDTILEIGPGFGALTIDLASAGARVFAVEKDKKAFGILKEICADKYGNLEIFNEDILNFEINKLKPAKRIKVIGSLPYYITTPIIEYLIENRSSISSMLVVIQREVANRLLARPGSKDYGSITCFIRYYADLSCIRTIKRTSFYPEPGVDSSLVRFCFLDNPPVKVDDEKLFFKIIRGAFNQRRKTVINSLSRKEVLSLPKDKLADILKEAVIDPLSRPEDLDLDAFARISNALS